MRDYQVCPSPLCDHHNQCHSAMVGEPCVLDKIWETSLIIPSPTMDNPKDCQTFARTGQTCVYYDFQDIGHICKNCKEISLSRVLADEMPFDPDDVRVRSQRIDWLNVVIFVTTAVWAVAVEHAALNLYHFFR